MFVSIFKFFNFGDCVFLIVSTSIYGVKKRKHLLAGWLAGWMGGWMDGWIDDWFVGWTDYFQLSHQEVQYQASCFL